MADDLLAITIVLLAAALVTSQDDFGYHECVYNSYRAVCMGSYELMRQENRGLTVFPNVTRRTTCLKLRRNAIERFPKDLNSLKDIVTLDVAINRISSLPFDLDKMSKLEILDLSQNMLEMLSPLTNFPASLRGLLLAKNGMKTIPSGIVVPGLFVLDLSQNQFTNIPDQFCMSDQLIRVDFTKNPLSKDLSQHIGTVSRCRNVNEIPFCLFTDSSNIKCDCSSVGPILGTRPNFCIGTPVRGQEIQCMSGSEDVYSGKKLFDVNVTMVKDTCPLGASHAKSAATTLLLTNTGIVIALIMFCRCAVS